MVSLNCVATVNCPCIALRGTVLAHSSHNVKFSILPSLHAWKPIQHKRSTKPSINAFPGDIEPVPAATLPSLNSIDEIEDEARWLSGMIRMWLDEEWTPLDIHRELGDATARIYMDIRQQGREDEVGDVILDIANGLLTFNFRETFTGPFDVANKVAELLMLKRSGCDVCCVTDEQKEAIDRWDNALRNEQPN